jgi:predicted Zn finger-like uncharacterized protein
MRIACPGCNAMYDVPDAMLAGGTRTVRCARCSSEWKPQPVATEAPLPTEAADADISFDAPAPHDDASTADSDAGGPVDPNTGMRVRAMRAPARPPASLPAAAAPKAPRRGAMAIAIAAWAASLLVLAVAGGAAVSWRSQVIAAWPPSERVYAMIGLR